MIQVNIHEAKTNLSKLIAEGQEVIIARYGEPVARLTPIRKKAQNRKPGSAKGKFEVSDKFFEPLPDDILNGFGA
ncbi:type II toxin-antitoxin system Phd/YefM family antitoxin [bacterium]|nr:type II toxin-antitoxin system Phd/YefM family antitoxin [bacterium]